MLRMPDRSCVADLIYPTNAAGAIPPRGSVVVPWLRVAGVGRLRVADANVILKVVGGNTNPAAMMIGGKSAAMIAATRRVRLAEFVGDLSSARFRKGNRYDKPRHLNYAAELAGRHLSAVVHALDSERIERP